MKKILALLLCMAMVLSLTAMLASCGSSDDEEDEDKGAIFNVYYVGEVYDFDPALAYTDDEAIEVLGLIFSPLFTINENGKLEKELVDDYEYIEDDARNEYVLEITLKESRWSDGRLIQADDVVFAWKRILACDSKSQAAPLLYDIKNAVAAKKGEVSIDDVGMKADGNVLTITFEEGVDYEAFLYNLASYALVPLRENVVSFRPEFWAKQATTISCSGPFALKGLDYGLNRGEGTIQINKEFRLERNPYYMKDMEKNEAVDKFVTPYKMTTDWDISSDDALAKFIEGTVFYIGEMSLANRNAYKDDAIVTDLLSTYSYVFNTKNELFQNPEVRLALSEALDRQEIANKMVFGVPATGFISHGVWDALSKKDTFREEGKDLISTTANIESARQRLQNAGVHGGSFTLSYLDTEENRVVAEYAKGVWESLGFDVRLDWFTFDSVYYDSEELNLPTNILQKKYESGEFDVIAIDYQMYGVNAFVPLCGFSTSLSGNGIVINLDEDGVYDCDNNDSSAVPHISGFSDPEYDAIIDRAYAEKDAKKRAAILHEAEEYLLSKMPIIPLVFNQNFALVSDELKKVEFDWFGRVILTKAKLKNYEDYLPEN